MCVLANAQGLRSERLRLVNEENRPMGRARLDHGGETRMHCMMYTLVHCSQPRSQRLSDPIV